MLFAFYRIPLTNSVRFMDMVLCLFREVTVILEKLNTTSSDLIQPGKHSNLSFCILATQMLCFQNLVVLINSVGQLVITCAGLKSGMSIITHL